MRVLRIITKTCFVSVDIEGDFGKNESFEGVENLDKILVIFKKYDIPLTLFVAGNVLEKFSQRFKELSKNYEIACHGFTHRFWDTLDQKKRKEELEKFLALYQKIFNKNPIGFRAPSHIIDENGLKLLEDKCFLYDSSVVPHYPFFKKYRGYKGKAPLFPYWPNISNCRERGQMDILEIPVRGQTLGIPLAGPWIARIPFWFYIILFRIYCPPFLTINIHSWDILDTPFRKSKVSNFFNNLDNLLNLLKSKNYQFLTGEQIYESISKNRK